MLKATLISLGSVTSKLTLKAMKKYFDEVDEINLKDIEINLGSKDLGVLHKGKTIKKYNCVFVKGSFRYAELLRSITTLLYKECYMPLEPSAFTTGHDKLLTHLVLQRNNIPMPLTYFSSSPEAAKELLGKLNYPIIMKFPSGTQGKGVMYADSFASASSMLDALATLKQPFIIQEYIETGGTDIRAIVVGDKVVSAMKRTAEFGEKRANIHAGGKGEVAELDSFTKKIAVNTAKALGAEICAVDILESHKGPVVIEANLSPGLQEIMKVSTVDIPDKIAKYLYEKTKEFVNKDKEKNAKKVLEDVGIESTEKPEKEIITNLDFRAERILLPKLITDITEFDEKEEVVFKAEKGKLVINKL